jgi:hypothetical protein
LQFSSTKKIEHPSIEYGRLPQSPPPSPSGKRPGQNNRHRLFKVFDPTRLAMDAFISVSRRTSRLSTAKSYLRLFLPLVFLFRRTAFPATSVNSARLEPAGPQRIL